jgi:hypothetical protein
MRSTIMTIFLKSFILVNMLRSMQGAVFLININLFIRLYRRCIKI